MSSNSQFEKIKAGRGFYIAVAVCALALVMSAGGLYYTAEKKKAAENQTGVISVPLAEYTSDEQRADANKNDVKDERTTAATTTENTTVTTATTAPTTAAAATAEAQPQTQKSADYVMPFGTELMKDYSDKAPVYSKTMNDWRIHPGIDFAGKEGDEVLSISNGKVKKIYSDEKWGTVAEISYGVSLTVRYCGLEQGTTVKTGDVVGTGEVIGSLGNIPCETLDGAHLHLETLVDGEYKDPLEVLGKAESTFAE
ncbi:MAG: M23 family metallopeptidase [Clostridia bacterium]|nr:M23 family metallopeptidase [Clostridia bacterium]